MGFAQCLGTLESRTPAEIGRIPSGIKIIICSRILSIWKSVGKMTDLRAIAVHSKIPDKLEDQHIIVDESAISEIVDAASLTEQDRVLEIGGGPGET